MAVSSVGAKSNKLLFAVIGILMLATVGATMLFLGKFYQTDVYYVLNTPVPTKTQITADMLDPIEVSKGGAPLGVAEGGVALSPADVQNGVVYSRIPLGAGELITTSNTGGFEPIANGIPDNWIVTSISVPADDAFGGRIQRGYYFDVMVIDEKGVFYPFVNILCLDTSVSLNTASGPEAANTAEAKTGQTQIYYIGMTPEDAARLQDMIADFPDIKLIQSPRQNEYNKPDFDAYTPDEGAFFSFDPENNTLTDQGELTNPNGTDDDRDEFGRPVNYWPNGERKDGEENNVGNSRSVPFDTWEEWLQDYSTNSPTTEQPTTTETE